ncbi:MAG TPA: hypothetical protein VG992_04505 [Candidatus Saccharimonadales bacterium]|nr:hypothetical protein [Candidatus Saccharimonadales bacterium]
MFTNPQQQCLVAPRVQIPATVWQKMMAYILNCPTEVNGFGYVEARGSTLVITDVFILDQVASAAHVETDQLALAAHMEVMRQAGREPSQLRFQWHSHVNMEAYFSGVDTGNIDEWLGDWLISLVANKRGEYSCRLDVLRGLRVGVEVTPDIVASIPGAVMQQTAQEIGQKVKQLGAFRRKRSLTDGSPAETNSFLTSPDTLVGSRGRGGL